MYRTAATDPSIERKPLAEKARAKRALELVATRGREVIGVRHLLEGGTAWVGDMREALARVPLSDLGGQPLVVGAVTREEHVLYVPPRARARTHGAGAIPRILVGPQRIPLEPGERAVLILGQIQIRARVVDIEGLSQSARASVGVVGWVALVISIYIAALTVCAAVAPTSEPRLEPGSLQRVQRELVHRLLPR